MQRKKQETSLRGKAKKRQFDLQRDHALFIQKLCSGRVGFLNIDEDDLTILREGESVFLWESPLAKSAEEAADMARQAATDMVPAPGRAILASILYVMTDGEGDLASVEGICDPIRQMLPKAGTSVFGVGFYIGQKGIRFLLATSEGSADERGNHDDLCDVGSPRLF